MLRHAPSSVMACIPKRQLPNVWTEVRNLDDVGNAIAAVGIEVCDSRTEGSWFDALLWGTAVNKTRF